MGGRGSLEHSMTSSGIPYSIHNVKPLITRLWPKYRKRREFYFSISFYFSFKWFINFNVSFGEGAIFFFSLRGEGGTFCRNSNENVL